MNELKEIKEVIKKLVYNRFAMKYILKKVAKNERLTKKESNYLRRCKVKYWG